MTFNNGCFANAEQFSSLDSWTRTAAHGKEVRKEDALHASHVNTQHHLLLETSRPPPQRPSFLPSPSPTTPWLTAHR